MITTEELTGLLLRQRNGQECDNERGMDGILITRGTDGDVITAEERTGI